MNVCEQLELKLLFVAISFLFIFTLNFECKCAQAMCTHSRQIYNEMQWENGLDSSFGLKGICKSNPTFLSIQRFTANAVKSNANIFKMPFFLSSSR